MHNNKNTQDFDLYIKKALQNAEEQPSPRVWEAIESKLSSTTTTTTATQRSTKRPYYLAFAVAAAIAAVVIIPSTRKNSNLNNYSAPTRPLLAQTTLQLEPKSIDSPASLKDFSGFRCANATLSSANNSALSSNEQDSVSTLEADFGTNTNGSASNKGKSTNSNSASNSAHSKNKGANNNNSVAFSNEGFSDFDAIEKTQSKRPIKMSAYLNGTVAGNESASKGAYMGAKVNSSYIANDITENTASNYSIPLSFGAGVRFQLNNNLALGVGLDYSLLSRSFTGTYNPIGALATTQEIRHDMSYIGIPLSVSYNIFNGKDLRFYLYAIGEAEWCVNNNYNLRASGQSVSEKVSGTQLSLGAGFGVEFRLTNLVGLYIDPSARYYFDCGHPNNIRSERPLMAVFNTGLRFNF